MASWRQRETNLLRVLSARNLDTIRVAFESLTSPTKNGLSSSEFVQSLLRLFGNLMFDKQEFCIQILELFASIDVRCTQRARARACM
ncbi:MAG: hypothetical protein EOO65_02025 [Methanosarcinales archaeon]|nr:MAG: hypothetical protein EOO65_02025 [Methanosarcinales archaeon]